jgi:hypothetical protein
LVGSDNTSVHTLVTDERYNVQWQLYIHVCNSVFSLWLLLIFQLLLWSTLMGSHGRDLIVVRYTTTYAYHHLLLVWIPLGVLDTTLCDKVCQWLVAGRWFSPGTPVSSDNKTYRYDIANYILLKVALNTITHPNHPTLLLVYTVNSFKCRRFQFSWSFY